MNKFLHLKKKRYISIEKTYLLYFVQFNVSFSKYPSFCVFDESTNLNMCDVILSITAYEVLSTVFFEC